MQAFRLQPGNERLDERDVRGFPGRDKSISTLFKCAQWSRKRLANSGSLSTRRLFGLPRVRTSWSRTSTTCAALKFALGVAESPSHVWMSTRVSIRIERPSNSCSDMKSIDQISLAASAPGRPSRNRQARLRGGRLERIDRLSSA